MQGSSVSELEVAALQGVSLREQSMIVYWQASHWQATVLPPDSNLTFFSQEDATSFATFKPWTLSKPIFWIKFSNSFWTNVEIFKSGYDPYNTRRRWLRNNLHHWQFSLYPQITSKLYFRTFHENSKLMAVQLNSFSILSFLVSTTVTLMVFREVTQLSAIRTYSNCNTHYYSI